MQKGNEAPRLGRGLGRPAGVVGRVYPGEEADASPSPLTCQPGHCSLCVSFFVYEHWGSKVSSRVHQAQRCHRPRQALCWLCKDLISNWPGRLAQGQAPT